MVQKRMKQVENTKAARGRRRVERAKSKTSSLFWMRSEARI